MNKAFQGYLFKKKIDVTEFCETENGKKESHFITLREPTDSEFFAIMEGAADAQGKDDSSRMMKNIKPLLPNLVFEHDFFDGEQKVPFKDVAEFISSKVDLLMYVVMEYVYAIPLVQKSVEGSKSSAGTSSKGIK